MKRSVISEISANFAPYKKMDTFLDDSFFMHIPLLLKLQ